MEVTAFFVVREFTEGGEEVLGGPYWSWDQAQFSETYSRGKDTNTRYSTVSIKPGVLTINWV